MISVKGTVTLQMHFNLKTKALDETEGRKRTTRCLDTLQEIRRVACLTVKP